MDTFVGAVLLIYIAFAVMLVSGLAMSFFCLWFNIRKKHSVLTIIISILVFPLIYIPVRYTVGFAFGRSIFIVLFPYCVFMLVWAILNLNGKTKGNK